jgi:adenylate cyclase
MISAKRLHCIQIIFSILITAVLISGVCFSYKYGFLKRSDNYIYDLHVKWRGKEKVSGKILLVLMDEKSSVELKRHKETWSRDQIAQAIYNLTRAGAEIIGLDLVLSSPDLNPESDASLAEAINENNNVILAKVSASPAGEILPIQIFRDGMIGDGFIDVPLDEDEILRKIRFLDAKPLPDGNLQLSPSFSLEIVRSYLNLDFSLDFSGKDFFEMGSEAGKRLRLPYPELLINYKGDYTSFERMSYADAVMNRFSPDKVKGKIIIIGSSLVTQKDFFSTPFTRFYSPAREYKEKFGSVVEDTLGGKDPGISCHAYAIETILSGEFIKRLTENKVLLLTVIAGLAGLVFYIPAIGFAGEVILFCVNIVLVILFSHFMFLRRLVWIDISPFIGIIILQFVAGIMVQKHFDKKKTAFVTGLFGRYVSPGVVDNLIKGDIEATLKGHTQEVSILFSDLRGFTTLSEELGANDTSRLLNTYFDAMIPVVFKYGGTLDKLMGDAIMAFFGAPVYFPDHSIKAAEASLDMLIALKNLRLSEIKGVDRLNIGIGLNTGVVTIGNLGSHEFMDYTIIGDAVNLASRLESLNKVYSTNIIAGESAIPALKGKFLLRELDIVRVKGKENFVTIFEVAGYAGKADTKLIDSLNIFHEGLYAYRNKKWDTAEDLLKKTLEINPSDGPSGLYLKRIEKLRLSPPPDNWNGSAIFESK